MDNLEYLCNEMALIFKVDARTLSRQVLDLGAHPDHIPRQEEIGEKLLKLGFEPDVEDIARVIHAQSILRHADHLMDIAVMEHNRETAAIEQLMVMSDPLSKVHNPFLDGPVEKDAELEVRGP